MSMSQEEIEALLNGLDIVEEETASSEEETPAVEEESTSVVNTDEIEELISQNEESKPEEIEKSEPEEEVKTSEELDVPEEVKTLDVKEEENSSSVVGNDDIDSLLKDLNVDVESNDDKIDENIDSVEDIDLKPVINNDITVESFDDISADNDGIVESTSKIAETDSKEENNNDEIGKDWADSKINEGVFPLPADNDTKVVNQLTEVANDSEEKVSQIFDVLSLTLDNNSEIRNKMQGFEKYINEELDLLNSLSTKFPNIEVFNTQKEASNKLKEDISSIKSIVDAEDMKIFEAMELMQFNDINRQKIERVMAVIRKLSLYLNNIFEDTNPNEEIVVAKHIHGDSDHDLIGDDLDKLINEYSK